MLLGNLVAQFSSFLGLRLGSQVPFAFSNLAGHHLNALGPVIDAKFSSYVEHLLDKEEIKGVSLAVVKPGGDTEYGAWGIRTEDGEKMTSDVSLQHLSIQTAAKISRISVDALQHRILLKGFPGCLCRDFN